MEERLLRAFAGLINQLRQEDLGIEQYIWRSQDDAKVRDGHAAYDDRVFRWDTPQKAGIRALHTIADAMPNLFCREFRAMWCSPISHPRQMVPLLST